MLAACTSEVDELEAVDDGRTMHTAILRFEGDVERLDPQTRATSSNWDNGATLYIQYQTSNGLVDGTAIYNQSRDEWTVSFYGTITKGQTAKCEVYYFENAAATTVTAVTLNAQSAVLADSQASYIYEDGIITLRGHLKHKTGRIRFRGTTGYQFFLSGLKWYSGYNISSNTLSQQSGQLTLTVGQDGYTPYVYAEFADATARQLTVLSSDGNYTFYKTFDTSVLATSKSGYINAPTVQNRNGWKATEKDPLGLCPNTDHPHMIDMGTGVKFACCNVGASSPIDYGDYFAWGETTSKSTYNWSTYKWCKGSDDSMTKYCNSSSYGTVDNKTQLELADDAARANWGGTWRMPTIGELEKLINSCTWTWTTISNVKGYKVTASNGSVLFLPAAGGRNEGSLYYAGSSGGYWSSSLDTSGASDGRELSFDSGDRYTNSGSLRCSGRSVRPVTE